MTPANPRRDAEQIKRDLAAEYRRIADSYTRHADRLDNATVEQLAETPVPYVHRTTRDLEDALNDALMAL